MPDRARRVVPGACAAVPGTSDPWTTHSAPCRGYGARFAVQVSPRAAWSVGPGIPLPLPTLVPYPARTPVPVPARTRTTSAGEGAAGSATYDRFEDL